MDPVLLSGAEGVSAFDVLPTCSSSPVWFFCEADTRANNLSLLLDRAAEASSIIRRTSDEGDGWAGVEVARSTGAVTLEDRERTRTFMTEELLSRSDEEAEAVPVGRKKCRASSQDEK